MTSEEQAEKEEPLSKWQCKECGATIKWDLGPPLKQDTYYPAETGPYADRQKHHICPVQAGLLPIRLKEHPNATKVE